MHSDIVDCYMHSDVIDMQRLTRLPAAAAGNLSLGTDGAGLGVAASHSSFGQDGRTGAPRGLEGNLLAVKQHTSSYTPVPSLMKKYYVSNGACVCACACVS